MKHSVGVVYKFLHLFFIPDQGYANDGGGNG